MKNRILLSLFAALTAGSLLLSGCSGFDLTEVNQEETTLSAELEQENLSDGNVQLHSVWYNTDDTVLASATITFSDGRDELFSGTTDEYGNLETCTLTGNTTLTCEVTDSAGETIANAEIVFKISDDYESLSVYPVQEEGDSEHVLEMPSAKTDVRLAVFLTEDKEITIANVSPYYESTEESTDDSADANTEETTSTDGSADTTTTDGTADTTTTDGTATTDGTTDTTTTDGTADTTTDGTADTTTDGTADTTTDGTADTTTAQ